MVDLILVRTVNNPIPGVKKNSDSGSYAGCRIPPFGILNIANFVRMKGYSVKLVDLSKKCYASLTSDGIADHILSHNPRIIGISYMTCQSMSAMSLGDALMRKSNVPVVHGGVHSSVLPEEALKHGHVVVQGDGEQCMLEMVASKEIDLNNKIVQGKTLSSEEMDTIPFPKKEDYDETAFDPSLTPHFPIITSRGCPYRCVFCKDGYGLRSSKVRYHSVDYIVEYFDYLYRTYGIRDFGIMDDIFVSSVARMEEMVVKLEKRNLKLKLQCNVHANIIKPDLLKLMQRIGIQWTFIGIESGNDKILKNINKGITVKKVKEAVHLLKKYGFYVSGLYMIGNIGETPPTINDTIRFAFSLPTDRAWFSFAAPYPGTPFYDMVGQYGEIIEPDFSKWNQASLVYLPKGISKREMYQLMRKAQMVRFYKKVRYSLLGCWTTALARIASKK
ncbi:MAG: B12-binding domain-containing radical SAM protein [Candidatus Scalindua sp.]|nr:B12-binding domain-containing radical SAM protein [Candidatus Scalindua sp.]